MTGESDPVSDSATLDVHLCSTHTLCIWILGYSNHPVELGSLRIWANVQLELCSSCCKKLERI